MGFPVGYTDILIPPLFLHTLTYLSSFHSLLFSLLSSLGLDLGLDPVPTPDSYSYSNPNPTRLPPPSASLTRDLLPLVKLSDIEDDTPHECQQQCCSVCLYDVCFDDQIRRLDNCQHVFHRHCLDRWIELDHYTCPLCRRPLLPRHSLRLLNQRLLSAHYDDDDDDELII
ncbi:hypothetical protein vseg_019027 [Gypsophila vaccaria]